MTLVPRAHSFRHTHPPRTGAAAPPTTAQPSSAGAHHARVPNPPSTPPLSAPASRQVLRFDERSVPAKLAVAEAYRAQGRNDLALYIINDLVNGSDPNHPNNTPSITRACKQTRKMIVTL